MNTRHSNVVRATRSAVVALAFLSLSSCLGGPSKPEPVYPVKSIRINPATPTMVVGTSTALIATALDESLNVVSLKKFEWKSTDGTIVEALLGGVITAKKPGITTITATVDGVTGTSQVTVIAAPIKN